MITKADLPPVRGRIMERAQMAAFTWFRVGGPADIIFMPADNDDLAAFLKACLLYTSPSPRDLSTSRMPSSA